MGHSYWKKQSALPPQVDIVIVGGGFIGLSVAYWLKYKKPLLKIALLDSQALGEGASGRNAGFLTKGSLSFYEHLTHTWGQLAAEDIFHFAQESIDLLASHLSCSDFLPTSSYTLYSTKRDFHFPGFERVAPLWVQAQDCFRAAGEISINPMVLLTKLEDVVSQQGVEIFRGVECLRLAGKTVHTNMGEMEGGEVVIALNGYTASLLAEPITPARAQMLCVDLHQKLNIAGLVYEPESRVYFKSIASHRLVIGGKRLIDKDNEETSLLAVNFKIQQALLDYVTARLGTIKSIQGQWSGIMGFSADELPLLEKRKDYYLIGGFSGHGMGLGFNASRNLSDMMIDNKTSFFHSIRTRCRDHKA